MVRKAQRIEIDFLGECHVPADAYWGIHTQRAAGNFQITGQPLSTHSTLIRGIAAVKMAAAKTNRDLGILKVESAAAIVQACTEILNGQWHEQFIVDVIQGGAGTSTNMNANEVIANRSLEILGYFKGDYHQLHPTDHVNLSQSTNDVYPTAAKIATITSVQGLLVALELLAAAFENKGLQFRRVLKMGRTQLQDAVPMTLGQEFRGYYVTLKEDCDRLSEAVLLLHEINLGATAIGTGINAPAGYASLVRAHLAEITDLPLVTAPDLVEATQDVGAFVHLSGVLKRIAIKTSKICNDLRLLSSGPRSGLNEINLPAVQSGSSIMPGKVNPVIPEVVNQVAFEVVGNDVTITMAAEAGQLQLNAFEPIIVHSLNKSITHLQAACISLADKCVDGITANDADLRVSVERSIGLITALSPYIGYEVATAVAHEAQTSGRGVAELVLEQQLLSAEQLTALLIPERLANLVM